MAQPMEPQEALPSTITKLPIQEGPQRAGINQLFQQGLQYFNPATQEEYTRKQFAKQLPGFAERFNVLGGGQGMSQAAQHELGGLQANLENQILGQRYQHGLNALKLGLTPQYEYLYKEPPLSFKDALLGNLAQTAAEGIPNIAAQGAQYLANRFMGNQPQQGAAGTIASTLAAPATQAVGSTALQALQNTSPVAQAQEAAQTAQAGVANQQAQQLSQAAATGATSALGTAAGTAGAGTAANALKTAGAVGAASLAPLATALGVPLALAATGFGGIKAYQWYQDFMQSKFGTSIPPLPANWNELTGPQRTDIQLGRQLTTPQGQVTHEEIEHLERQFGIKADSKVPWDQRWQNVTNKVAGLEQELGIEPLAQSPWLQRYNVAKAKKGRK